MAPAHAAAAGEGAGRSMLSKKDYHELSRVPELGEAMRRPRPPHPNARPEHLAAVFARAQELKNYAAVGREYKISRERVRQIVVETLRRLGRER